MNNADGENRCPSIYHGIVTNPSLMENLILLIYTLIFFVGFFGNVMTVIIIRSNEHLKTPTNFYLLNLAISDLMMLMCNLPIEMMEIYHRQWPLSIIFCKLRNVCAEFFTCSSILTILAFTCERYFAIVHPIHLHRLSYFRRAETLIVLIWLISLIFSCSHGFCYEIQTVTNVTSIECKTCVTKKSFEKLLSIVIIVSSLILFYLPMIIIAAIYLYIAKALRRLNRYKISSLKICEKIDFEQD